MKICDWIACAIFGMGLVILGFIIGDKIQSYKDKGKNLGAHEFLFKREVKGQ